MGYSSLKDSKLLIIIKKCKIKIICSAENTEDKNFILFAFHPEMIRENLIDRFIKIIKLYETEKRIRRS